MFMVAGPVRHKVRAEPGSKFVQRVIVRERHEIPSTDLSQGGERPHIASVYRWLSESSTRNQDIVQDVEGKQEVSIYDYLDTGLPMLERMFRKREKGYKAMGYQLARSEQQTRLL
ncbi:MAG: hypothetical protein L0J77_10395 [Marinobacter sp.]|nr:hypothetical protein [Marinobacter sp.]